MLHRLGGVFDGPTPGVVGLTRPADVVAEIDVSRAASTEDLRMLIRVLESTDRLEVSRIHGPSASEPDLFLERTDEVGDA